MKQLLRHRLVHVFLRLMLGGFFVYSSLDKISDPVAFATIVYQWRVVGPILSNLVAVILPWVELFGGVLLFTGVWRRESALLIALLLVVFLGAAGSVVARGIEVHNCGCVSVAAPAERSGWPPAWTEGVGWFLIGRNVVFLGVALILSFVEPVRNASRES